METQATHAVFATLADHSRVRVTEPASWNLTQLRWSRLDDARLAGRKSRGAHYPNVRHFEVRSMDDPNYNQSPARVLQACLPGRGFKNAEDAARVAWRLLTGNSYHRRNRGHRLGDLPGESTGVQGVGGWFYWPNGVPAAQGLYGLVRVCRSRNLVQQGCNGRWYVTDTDFDADTAKLAA